MNSPGPTIANPTFSKAFKPSPKKVGLMGPFGFGNLGDAAIQQSVIQQLKARFPGVKIIGFSLNPEDTESRHNIESFPVGRIAHHGWVAKNTNPILLKLHEIAGRKPFNQNKFLKLFVAAPLEFLSVIDATKNIKDLEYFLISGGGQLDDYWGGAWHHPYTMFVWSTLAKLYRVKLLFISVGAGPLNSPLSRWFVRRALSLADYRSYRDERSKCFIKNIGFKQDDPVYPDLAHSLQLQPSILSEKGISREIGIGPMAYFDPRVWPERDQAIYMGYLEKLAQFAAWLIQQGYTIRLFPGEAVHDRFVIADFLELLRNQFGSIPGGQVINEPVDTVDELMSQLLCMEFVVASRFHGVLLAQLVNKPVLALSYHEKIDALMEDTGQSTYCLPIDRFEVDTLKERFLVMEENSQTITTQVAKRVNEYRAALDEQYEHIFNGLN